MHPPNPNEASRDALQLTDAEMKRAFAEPSVEFKILRDGNENTIRVEMKGS